MARAVDSTITAPHKNRFYDRYIPLDHEPVQRNRAHLAETWQVYMAS